eukprot:1695751-Pleurochrysis_carterae.AAC.1
MHRSRRPTLRRHPSYQCPKPLLPRHHLLLTTPIPRHRRLRTIPTRRCRRDAQYPIPCRHRRQGVREGHRSAHLSHGAIPTMRQ